MAEGIRLNTELNGWSALPNCSWIALDKEGKPCCKLMALRQHLVALGIARFTVFDQRYVSEAIANWRENFPDDYKHVCSPRVCPSRLTRLINEFHKKTGSQK